MGSDFSPTNLGSLLSFSNGRSSPERADGLRYPVYGSNGVIGYANETNADSGTIIIGRVGSYCGSLYQSKRKCWVTDNAIRANALDGNDPRFLFYLLNTLNLNNWRAGSGQPLLNQSILSSISAAAPDPPEQRAIAHILGTLEDKIELNQRMNETLEGMAWAIFKSWFVDFDPVKRNIERKKKGRRSSNDPQSRIDRLFPNTLINSDIGNLPYGWEMTEWGSIATLEYGKRLSGYKDSGGKFPVYGTNGQIGWHEEPLCPHSGVIIGRKGAYRGVHFSNSPFFVIDTAFYLKPAIEFSHRWAFYEISSYDIDSMDSGSAIPSTSRDSFYSITVHFPPKEIHDLFDDKLRPIWERQGHIQEEIKSLTMVRNSLLPKLISGEIRIKDAEKFVERAVS